MRRFVAVFLVVCFVLGFFAQSAHAEVATNPQGVLALSKLVGACGIVMQIIDFQAATKMDGGDEFVARFVKTETSRMGLTEEEFFKKCEQSAEAYQLLFNSMEQEKN